MIEATLTLESHVTDRWTKNPVNKVYFDNLGCMSLLSNGV
jgi:hypothetical protein